jgi:outer membrane protein TolC
MIRIHPLTAQHTISQGSIYSPNRFWSSILTGIPNRRQKVYKHHSPQTRWQVFVCLSVFLLGVNPLSVTLAESMQSITLLQAVKIAVEQNSDVLLARLDVEKATHTVRETKAPFSPQLHVGSGLAMSSGIPQSVDGASPAIMRAVGRQFIFNRKQSNHVKRARELVVASEHAVGSRKDEVAYRVASTYLDFEKSWRRSRSLHDQIAHFTRIENVITAQVADGLAIPLAAQRARLDTATANRALKMERARSRILEATLRYELGLARKVRLRPAPTDFVMATELPEDVGAAWALALDRNPELQRIAADLRANKYARLAEKGSLLPRIDLVAQYSLLGRFNKYEDFFNKFQRHNGQFGVSLQIPVFGRKEVKARTRKIRVEAQRLGVRQKAIRSWLNLEITRLYEELDLADDMQNLSRAALNLTREKLSVQLAKFDEGQISMEEIERARLQESLAWNNYYDSQYALQKKKVDVMHQTGQLVLAGTRGNRILPPRPLSSSQ